MDENEENVVESSQEQPETAKPKRKYTRKQPAEKPAAEKKPVEENVVLQYDGEEWSLAEFKERAISTYIESGHRRGNIKKISLYIKPEERKVYYVMNDKESGGIDFD